MATTTLMTLGEFERLPEPDGMRHELVEGELTSMTFPKPKHAGVVSNVHYELKHFVKANKIGRVALGTGFVLGRDPDTLRGPDVAFLSARRAKRVQPDEFIEGAPDLAVEVASPSDSAEDLMKKVRQYLAAGGHTVWVVYPSLREAHVFEASGGARVVRGDESIEALDLLPGFSLPVSRLFEES
ncbi:MAG: Uma2 family endonuclease [Acidobacteriota bacterium]